MPYLSLDQSSIIEGESITLTISKPPSPSKAARIGFITDYNYYNRGQEIDLQGWGSGTKYDPPEIDFVYQLTFSSWDSQKTINSQNNQRQWRGTIIPLLLHNPQAYRDGWNSYYDEIDIAIRDIDFNPPTNILISGNQGYVSGAGDSSFAYKDVRYDENDTVNASWSLQSEDSDKGDEHAYSLVEDDSYPDNQYFEIKKPYGSPWLVATKGIAKNESKSDYLIKVRSTDLGGEYTEREISVKFYGLPGAPTGIDTSGTLYENTESGSAAATLITIDTDPEDTHSYSFVSGDFDTDNSAFTIEGDQLKIIDSPDFERKSSYFVRLQTQDSRGLTLEKSIHIYVNDINEVPEDLAISTLLMRN